MADNRDFAALEWLIHEINETLKDARQSLENFVENPDDISRIRFCLTHIHQVHGSLQIVEFYGAALLASEMEALTQAIIAGKTNNLAEAQEVLMRAILQFPQYLEQVTATRKDNPLIVLPLLNDLRAVRGESLLTDTKLFMPNLSPAKKIYGARLAVTQDSVQFQAMALKLRQMYQYAASGFIRDVNADENLAYLHKVFTRLHKLTQGTARFALWDISLALIEAIEADALEISVAVKNLLRQLDKEIKVLAVHGTKALNSFTSDDLIKNLLYYVARAGKHTPSFNPDSQLYHIYTHYHLEEALLEGKETGNDEHLISAPDHEAMVSVVTALKDELAQVKNALEPSMLEGEDTLNHQEILAVMKRIADTLAILGLGDLRVQLTQQRDILAANLSNPSPAELMQVAESFVSLENALDRLVEVNRNPTHKVSDADITLTRARDSVLRESRNGLEHAKDAIIEYIASQWNSDFIVNVPNYLREIRGGLDIIQLKRPARILSACARFVEEKLLRDATPEWSSLDTLADAITSVEYYLERLSGRAPQEENELLLLVAEEAVSALGYSVGTVSRSAAEESDTDNATPVESTIELPLIEIATTSADEDEAPVDNNVIDYSLSEETPAFPYSEKNNAEELNVETTPLQTINFEAHLPQVILEESDLPVVAVVEIEEQETDTECLDNIHEETLIATNNAPIIERNNGEIDEEIIEIFIEEATEVLETIAQYFPQWAKNFDNINALTEFRRAFHTLKGSGRMVGANDIGELAWSIENMLNRVMDRTLTPRGMHVKIIQDVLSLLPEMVDAFRQNVPNPYPAEAAEFSGYALVMARDETPEQFFGKEDLNPFLETVSSISESAADLIEEKTSTETEARVSPHLDENTFSGIELDDESESQLWEIFGTEAESHLVVVSDFIEEMTIAAPIYTPPSEATQRALHTLKGSAHMANIGEVAELVSPLERLMKELRSYQVRINDDILQLLIDSVTYTEIALAQIRNAEPIAIPRLQQFLARVNELHEIHVAPLIRQQEDANGKIQIDPELLKIFMAEEMNLLLDADVIIADWQKNPSNMDSLRLILDELQKLTQAANHAYLPVMATLGEKLQEVYSTVINQSLHSSEELCQGLLTAHNALLDMVNAVAAGQNLNDLPETVRKNFDEIFAKPLNAVDALHSVVEVAAREQEVDATLGVNSSVTNDEQPTEALTQIETPDSSPMSDDFDIEIVEIFVEEAEELLEEIDAALVAWQDDSQDPEPVEELKRHLHTFKGGARLAGLKSLGDVSHDFETYIIDNSNQYVDAEGFNKLYAYQDQLHHLVAATRAFVQGDSATLEPAQITSVVPEPIEPYAVTLDHAVTFNNVAAAPAIEEEIIYESSFSEPAPFIEEEITEELALGLTHISEFIDLDDSQSVVHALNIVADEIDTDINPSMIPTLQPEDGALWLDPAFAHAELIDEEINLGDSEAPTPEASVTQPSVSENNVIDNNVTEVDFVRENEALAHEPAVNSPRPNILTFAPKARPQQPQLPNIPGLEFGGTRGNTGQHLAARRSGPQEVIKVSADLLEELVNLAGETSISRGRMEQQVSDLGTAIGEMDATIHRLQEQLRRLDIETEAQVLFRQEQMAQFEEFDPLEMDRYSQLQQLSRSLIESASDLMDLKYTLADKTRDTETLLLQQSRINTDLQEGLMRSRMVPFSRLVPRLRRIVRQAASELGKEVDFELDNIEGELDRTVLERMVAPLEHMLRNAVDHGIESPSERSKQGKTAVGRIQLSLAREGGDVVLRLNDDGRGINLERVRAKAIERGLMAENAQVSDQDVIQFILHAGFSTADKVTQISGRGVGMDVVHSEIKQLGGAMFIDSDWGQGTAFTIRLPFTVSVNRALMVQIGDDLYAIPLNTIEGIVRVSPFELEHYYQETHATFDYAGEEYLIRYLGTMLESEARPKLDGHNLPLPVILVRSAESTVALQVDRLLGSREIVVKTLGAQFSAVHGVSGATVMGDGNVVVILDLHALIREQIALNSHHAILLDAHSPHLLNADKPQREKLVLVVDDSVTVRKVTSRFLEREGFQVMTAKDGIEALQVLQDTIPDLMLLDIEMPRMDGFEVAKNIRTSSRLSHLPIIMITSRTGDKHRERALSLGVNRYLGKPYQEDLLLQTISELLT